MTSRIVRNSVVLVVLAVFGLAVLWTFMGDPQTNNEIAYGTLIENARDGRYDSVTQEGTRLTAKTDTGEFIAIVPNDFINVYADLGCASGGVPGDFECGTFEATEPSAAGGILTLLITALLPVLLIGGFIFFMMRQAQGTNNQAMSFGKSRARCSQSPPSTANSSAVSGLWSSRARPDTNG